MGLRPVLGFKYFGHMMDFCPLLFPPSAGRTKQLPRPSHRGNYHLPLDPRFSHPGRKSHSTCSPLWSVALRTRGRGEVLTMYITPPHLKRTPGPLLISLVNATAPSLELSRIKPTCKKAYGFDLALRIQHSIP